jgi:hypothetical protein
MGLHFALSPNSKSRRRATDRLGLSGCLAVQRSTCAINLSVRRTVRVCAASPVTGRPTRLLAGAFFTDLAIINAIR